MDFLIESSLDRYLFLISSTNLSFSFIFFLFSSYFLFSCCMSRIYFFRLSISLLPLLRWDWLSSVFVKFRTWTAFLLVVIGGRYFSRGVFRILLGGLVGCVVWLRLFCWFYSSDSSSYSCHSSSYAWLFCYFFFWLAWKLARTCETIEKELWICCLSSLF